MLLLLACGIELPWMLPHWARDAARDPAHPELFRYDHGSFVEGDFDGDGLGDVAHPVLGPEGRLGVGFVLRREGRLRALLDPTAAYVVRIGGRSAREWRVIPGSPDEIEVWGGCRAAWTGSDFEIACP